MTDERNQPAGQREVPRRGVRTNQMLDDEAKKGGQGSTEKNPSTPTEETNHPEAEGGQGDRGEEAPER